MGFLIGAATMIALTYGFYKLVERNLAEREVARHFRRVFLTMTEELVNDEAFPENKARLLVTLAGLRPGWVTRAMVLLMLKRALVGRTSSGQGSEWMKRLDDETLTKFAVAVLAFSLADSHHCAFFGRFYRAAYPWMEELTQSPSPADVHSSATSRVVYDVIHQAPREVQHHAPMPALG